MALGIVTLAVDLITSLAARVLFPAFSKLQDDLSQVARAYLRSSMLTSYITFPMIFGIMAVAPAAIVSVYGAQWQPVVELARVLCLFALFRTISRQAGGVLTAIGRPDLTTRLAVVRLVLLVILLVGLGTAWQTLGVAWAVSISMGLSGLAALWLTHRYLSISPHRFWSTIRSPLIAAALMAAVVTWIGLRMPLTLWATLAQVAVGVIGYSGILLLIDRKNVLRDGGDLWRLVREQSKLAK